MNAEIRAIDFRKMLAPVLIAIAITAGLFLISRYNYLFFRLSPDSRGSGKTNLR